MDPPKLKMTIQISTNLGPASQFADSLMTVIELKGRTHYEKGEHYLQLLLAALKELAGFLEDKRLSEKDKAAYNRAYITSRDRYDDVKKIRDRVLAQKKSFRKFIGNLFVRESDAKHFHKVSYRNFSSIKFLEALVSQRKAMAMFVRRVHVMWWKSTKPNTFIKAIFQVVRDLPPDETLRGINVDVHTEQEANEVFATLNQIAISGEEDREPDDDRTIRAPTSQSRPSSPSPSCTVIYNYNVYNHSVVSVDSEVTGTTINSRADGGAGCTTAP
ncbi:hypothetical protein BDR03DRAFT_987150 [Suillus americanus]|nr:hypothetical protein BDR03DRAFT_987150 [Suillus americanus]